MRRQNRIIYNPAVIYWQEGLRFVTELNMTLVGIIRLLIDQATSTGTLLDYPTAGDIFWPSQQLYDAGNEALVDFWPMLAKQSVPVAEIFTPFAISSGTDIFAYSTGSIMIPRYIVLNSSTNSGAAAQTIDQKYWITDVTKLEQYNNNWRAFTPATPKFFVLWDAFHIRTFPRPDASYTFTLFGVPWQIELGTGTEDIVADPILKLAIAYKGAATILETTRPDTADLYMKESEELVNRYRIRLRNSSSNNMRRMKPSVGSRGTDVTISAGKGVIKIGKRLS